MDAIKELGLKCVPGRTVIKVTEKEIIFEENNSESSAEDLRQGFETRRKHMTTQTKDEYCRICVCSAEGRDEYCSNRPAMNVNECMMMQNVMGKFNKSLPYEHENSLASRIRRGWFR